MNLHLHNGERIGIVDPPRHGLQDKLDRAEITPEEYHAGGMNRRKKMKGYTSAFTTGCISI
jgi:hypothetical protein